ncbi:MAG TPA: TolC family outer membrane protein [Rhizomicrobium sp.]|nr:TolC family outer membrane protein [Rhizomicrobium sp.]
MAVKRAPVAAACSAIVFACLVIATPALAETFTLAEALAMAYETNPQLLAQRADLRATDETIAQANAGWRPSINASGSYGYQCDSIHIAADPTNPFAQSVPGGCHSGTSSSTPLSGQLVVQQPIFRGGQTFAEVGRAKALDRAGRAQLLQTEEQVLLDTVTAYMDVVRDAAIMQLRQNSVNALQKQLDATNEEFKVGEVTKTDVAQALARLSVAQSDLTVARGQLMSSRAEFEQVVGRPAATLERSPALPALPTSLDTALQIGEVRSPVLAAAKANEKAAQYGVDDAAGALMPQLSVAGEYQYSKDAVSIGSILPTQRTLAVIGQLQVPIYQGGGDEATVRRAKQLHSETQIQIAQADRQVRQSVTSSWQNFTAAKSSISTNQTAVSANQTAYDGAVIEQQAGSRTILDVLNAEQELINSQVSVVISQHDTMVTAYQVLATTGQLTAHALALRVNYYDPQQYYDDNASRWFGFGDDN